MITHKKVDVMTVGAGWTSNILEAHRSRLQRGGARAGSLAQRLS